ncbi:uncharacterized protein L201_005842 [Kwoniella dendrophila CBS 6074]|uniref:ADF-H domain-containing protein n=1 Tax=Kwoniella dendrophila CBS 6074 TaxID=1295534 RepID=A0AAX4K155_9TREE
MSSSSTPNTRNHNRYGNHPSATMTASIAARTNSQSQIQYIDDTTNVSSTKASTNELLDKMISTCSSAYDRTKLFLFYDVDGIPLTEKAKYLRKRFWEIANGTDEPISRRLVHTRRTIRSNDDTHSRISNQRISERQEEQVKEDEPPSYQEAMWDKNREEIRRKFGF